MKINPISRKSYNNYKKNFSGKSKNATNNCNNEKEQTPQKYPREKFITYCLATISLILFIALLHDIIKIIFNKKRAE